MKRTRKQLMKDLKSPEVESWRLLMTSFYAVYQKLERGLLSNDCSIPRFQIFFYLYFDGPTQASHLSKNLFVSRGNVSMFLKRLMEEKLIQFSKKPKTGKRRLYELTAEGTRFFEGLFPKHAERIRTLVTPFSENTRSELSNLKAIATERQIP